MDPTTPVPAVSPATWKPMAPVRWSPTWAKVVAVLGILAMLGVIWLSGGMVLSGLPGFSGDPSAAYAAIGVFTGAPFLALGLLSLTFLVWFLVRGGNKSFVFGVFAAGISVGLSAMLVMLLFSSL